MSRKKLSRAVERSAVDMDRDGREHESLRELCRCQLLGLGGAVARSGDGAHGRRVAHLALEAGKLVVMNGDRLDEAVLHCRADRCVGLLFRLNQHGRIVELGTHDELLALNGYYTGLYNKQLLEEELETV